jgi:hypothetical protein
LQAPDGPFYCVMRIHIPQPAVQWAMATAAFAAGGGVSKFRHFRRATPLDQQNVVQLVARAASQSCAPSNHGRQPGSRTSAGLARRSRTITGATTEPCGFRLADTYGVQIEPSRNDVVILAVMVAIDMMAHP